MTRIGLRHIEERREPLSNRLPRDGSIRSDQPITFAVAAPFVHVLDAASGAAYG